MRSKDRQNTQKNQYNPQNSKIKMNDSFVKEAMKEAEIVIEEELESSPPRGRMVREMHFSKYIRWLLMKPCRRNSLGMLIQLGNR